MAISVYVKSQNINATQMTLCKWTVFHDCNNNVSSVQYVSVRDSRPAAGEEVVSQTVVESVSAAHEELSAAHTLYS